MSRCMFPLMQCQVIRNYIHEVLLSVLHIYFNQYTNSLLFYGLEMNDFSSLQYYSAIIGGCNCIYFPSNFLDRPDLMKFGTRQILQKI